MHSLYDAKGCCARLTRGSGPGNLAKQGRLRGVEVFKTTPVKLNLAKVSATAADDSARPGTAADPRQDCQHAASAPASRSF